MQRMLRMTADEIGVRADSLSAALTRAGWHARVIDGMSRRSAAAARLARNCRRAWSRSPATARARIRSSSTYAPWNRRSIARIQDDRVVIDLRTVLPADDSFLASLPAPTPAFGSRHEDTKSRR